MIERVPSRITIRSAMSSAEDSAAISISVRPRQRRSACGGRLQYLHRSPKSHRKRLKSSSPVPGDRTGPPYHWGGINTGTWSSRLGVGRNADDLFSEKN
jgi:hypothetical protein